VKRFWKLAAAEPAEGGHAVLLDGRPVRTPKGLPLVLPVKPLAQAVADEWQAVEAELKPHAMPLTGLSNAALDVVAGDHEGFAAGLARYAESDLLCYRAEHPAPLVARQAERWDPLLGWAEQRFDVRFRVLAGIVHQPQPGLALERIGKAYAAFGAFELAALSPLVSLSGSAVIPLALAEGEVDLETAWTASVLDELFQEENWGADALATASREDRRRQFEAAARFLRLAGSSD
jgi:chaperone required for assembly of F1-ATPase